MAHPGYASIFNRIRLEAGQKALKFARLLEKTTYKLEAHHRHLHFAHKALEQNWIPKSLRFRPPGTQPILKRIMERASMRCMKARVSICHHQIKAKNRTIRETLKELTPLVSADNLMALKHFLKIRAQAVRNSIDARHIKKLGNLHNEFNPSRTMLIRTIG